jgi:hypothetical protein
MVRYWMVGPSKKYFEESRSGHEKLIEGWRKAVQAAEKAHSDDYWPVHLNGEFTVRLLHLDYHRLCHFIGITLNVALL